MNVGIKAISMVSGLSLLVFLYYLWSEERSIPQYAIGILTYCGSYFLFGLAMRHTLVSHLKLAFDARHASIFVTSGPYAHVRHPFYTSYIGFWAASWVIAPSVVLGVVVVALGLLYFLEAKAEEQRLRSAPWGEQYRRYECRTGMFMPIIFGKHRLFAQQLPE